MYLFLFFFFKQKTAYEITEGDWSSDVCSSDLANAVLEAGRCAERRVRTPQSARGHRGQERRSPHAMDGVPGERHPGLGAEAYQRPGLTTELRRIGPTRRSGLKNKPRDRDDAGFDAELSDVPIEHARGSDQPACDRARRHF